MARILAILAVLALTEATISHTKLGRGHVGVERETALMQTFNRDLADSKVTPVTRVVNLLKEMTHTLEKEMEEDENLYKQLSCWCNDNVWAKKVATETNTAKAEELTATIETLTARSLELKTRIAELE